MSTIADRRNLVVGQHIGTDTLASAEGTQEKPAGAGKEVQTHRISDWQVHANNRGLSQGAEKRLQPGIVIGEVNTLATPCLQQRPHAGGKNAQPLPATRDTTRRSPRLLAAAVIRPDFTASRSVSVR